MVSQQVTGCIPASSVRRGHETGCWCARIVSSSCVEQVASVVSIFAGLDVAGGFDESALDGLAEDGAGGARGDA